jgi:hypothetical protein
MLVRRTEEGVALPENRENWEKIDRGRLLNAVVLHFRIHQGIEDGQNVAAVFQHAREDTAQLRLALRFPVPFGKHGGRNLDIPAKLLGGVSAEKKAIEKGRFALRILEIHSDFSRQV